jgi:hypothetical protein
MLPSHGNLRRRSDELSVSDAATASHVAGPCLQAPSHACEYEHRMLIICSYVPLLSVLWFHEDHDGGVSRAVTIHVIEWHVSVTRVLNECKSVLHHHHQRARLPLGCVAMVSLESTEARTLSEKAPVTASSGTLVSRLSSLLSPSERDLLLFSTALKLLLFPA